LREKRKNQNKKNRTEAYRTKNKRHDLRLFTQMYCLIHLYQMNWLNHCYDDYSMLMKMIC